MTEEVVTSETGLRPQFTAILIGAAVLVVLGTLAVFPRSVEPVVERPGSLIRAEITLVASDRRDVQCLAALGVDTFHCSFVDEKTKWRGLEAQTIRPYMTLDRRLYLIVGLFSHPALTARYHAEPADTPREQLRRFTATCTLKVIGRLEQFRLRWQDGAAFGEPQPAAAVATVQDCSVTG